VKHSESSHALEPISLPSAFGPLAARRAGFGPPLVLLHGGAGSWTHWIRNIPALARHYSVLAIDLPGCGDSPDVPRDVEDAQYVDAVALAIADFSKANGRVRLCGFSFGAATAVGVAARLGSSVLQLALTGPGGFGVPPGRALDLRQVPFDGGTDAEIDAALRHNLGVMMLADPAQADADTIALHRENVRRARFDSRRISLSEIMLQELPRVPAQTLIVWGEHDNLAAPSVDARAGICRALKDDLDVRIVAGAGHWVQYEAADEVNRVLLDFYSNSHSNAGKP
jgi:pimeloyl-ACP methyl ester carboxylesterase